MNSNISVSISITELTQLYLLIQHSGLLPEIVYHIMDSFIQTILTDSIYYYLKRTDWPERLKSFLSVEPMVKYYNLNLNPIAPSYREFSTSSSTSNYGSFRTLRFDYKLIISLKWADKPELLTSLLSVEPMVNYYNLNLNSNLYYTLIIKNEGGTDIRIVNNITLKQYCDIHTKMTRS
jgi:hypothetical protein